MSERLLMLLRRYPQLSETYIETEIRAVSACHAVKIVSLGAAELPARTHHPYLHVAANDTKRIVAEIEQFRPDVLHGHYVHHAAKLREVAQRTGLPFTVRAHSYDVLGGGGQRTVRAAADLNDDLCLGVLTFPFTVDRLIQAGVKEDKIVPCYPVVDVDRFADTGPNGSAVMNIGACLPKKNHHLFIDLATRVPDRQFHLYAMGYDSARIAEYNQAQGSPVTMHPLVEHHEMPRKYKRHEWLVYTASTSMATVGWPMAVAEAQASGVGICMQNIRPDLADYIGPGAYLFDTLDEVASIIASPLPQYRRQQGFAQARRSDIKAHLPLLEALWNLR